MVSSVTHLDPQQAPYGTEQAGANLNDPEMTAIDALQAILTVLNVISFKLSVGFNLPEDDTDYSANPTLLNTQQ